MKTELKATETSKKEVIAESIKEKVKDFNKILEKAYESGLNVNIEVLLENFEELEEAEIENELGIPQFSLSVKIFEQNQY